MDNALKFTDRGNVRFTVTPQRQDDETVLVRFEVTDSGIGVAESSQAQIFDAFAQADGSTTRRFGGTGLGLAICQQLVVAMKGEIGVESDGQSGSTFWFTVPMAFDPTRTAKPETDPTSQAKAQLSACVLLVEDNPVNSELARRQLQILGCERESRYQRHRRGTRRG